MTNRSIIILVVWLVAMVGSALLVGAAQFSANLSAFLPNSSTKQQSVFYEQLNQGVISRQIFIGIDGGNVATRAILSNDLVRILREKRTFLSVNNGGDTEKKVFNYLFNYRYLLSPTVSQNLFSVSSLHDYIANSIAMLAVPGGESFQSLFPKDPTGTTIQLLQSMGQRTGPVMRRGVWFSHSGKTALILAQTKALGSALHAQQEAVSDIHEAFDAAKARVGIGAKNITLIMSGISVISLDSRNSIVDAAKWMSLISIVLITILLLSIYRSMIALFLGLLPVLSGVLVGISAVSLGFPVIYDITMGFGTALMGEAVDYSIYFLVQSGQSDVGCKGWVENYWPTIRIGVITSLIGFASLLFSPLSGLSQLGLYAIVGLLTAAIITRWVLPTLLPKGFQSRDVSHLGQRLLQWMGVLRVFRPVVALMLLAACVILIANIDRVWNYKLSALSPISAEEQELYARMRADFGVSTNSSMVVVSGPTVDSALAVAQKAGEVLDRLVNEHLISGYESPTRYLPSVATQMARQEAIPVKSVLEKRLHEALSGLPVKASLFSPFIAEAERQRALKPLRLADLRGTEIETIVQSMLMKEGGDWYVLMPLVKPGTANLQQIRDAFVQQHVSGAMVVDVSDLTDQLYKSYLVNGIRLSMAGVFIITLFLLFVFRSFWQVGRILLPLLAAVLVVSAGFIVLGYHLDIMNLIGLMLIVAVGSNYALFFARDSGKEDGELTPVALASLVIANLATVLGFGPLAFSGVPVLQAIGATVAPGVVLALLFSASFYPRKS